MGRHTFSSPDDYTIATKSTGELFSTFGEFLRYLRRGQRLTQTDLGIAVGYSTQHIHLLESGQRLPDPTTVAALFVPALRLESHADIATRLVELANDARALARSGRHGRTTHTVGVQREVVRIETTEEIGTLEDPPPIPPMAVQRPAALARLRERLSVERFLVLSGLPGMGKTSLAATLAREYASANPVLWLTFTEGVNTSPDALVRQLALFAIAYSLAPAAQVSQLIGRGTDPQPLSLDRQVLLLGSVLSQQTAAPALLCFDNTHLILADQPMLNLLTRLMATSPASFLFVSREDLPVPGLAHLQLDGLQRDEAAEFMQHLVGPAGATNRVEPEALQHRNLFDRLYERTAGSPMLLRLSLGQMMDRHLDAARFIEQIATQPQIDSYLLGTIISGLSTSSRRLASLVAVLRRPVNLYDPTLVDLMREGKIVGAGVEGEGLPGAMAELQHRHILDSPGQAALHPLLRDYMAAILATDPDQWKKMHLLAARYSEQGLGDIVEAAYHYCRASKLEEMAGALADQGTALFNQGKGQAALEVLDDGIAQARRKRTAPAGLLRRLLTVRGDLLASSLRAGEAEANYREALALALQEGSAPPVRAQVMMRLASCLTQRSHAPEAFELCRQGLEMLGPGDTLLAAQLTTVQSGVLAIMGHFEEAETSGKRALELSDGLMPTLPDVVLGIRARVYNVLGMVSAIRQRHDDALRHWSSAIEAARQVQYVQLEYRCRGNMGNVFYEKGDLERATQYCAEAVLVLQSIGDDYGAVRFMHTLGNAQYMRHSLDDAIKTLGQAAEIKERMGDRPGHAISLAMQGMALLAQGHVAQARTRVEDALRALEGLEATRVQGYVLIMLCDTQIASGDLHGARATLEQAEHLAGAETDLKWLVDLQNHKALALLAAGGLEAARMIAPQTPSPEAGMEVALMHDLIDGMLAHLSGDPGAATALFEQVAVQAREAGYLLYEATAERLRDVQASQDTPAQLAKAFYC